MASENIIMAMVKTGADRQVSKFHECFVILINAHVHRNATRSLDYCLKRLDHKLSNLERRMI